MNQLIIPCASPQSSECVLYVGDQLKTQTVDPTCLPTLTKIVQELDKTIDTITKSIDITGIQSCLSIDVKKAKLGDFLQAIVSSLCTIKNDITQLKQKSGEDLLATPVQIDLSCLGSSCDNSSASTLLTILTTLTSEVCALKQQNNSNNDLYLPN